MSITLTFIICLIAFGLFYNFYLKHLVIETTKLDKQVTITDSGIADAVDKIYDAVVTIETYRNGQLYATGSGFVFKTDDKYGYILTNNHVIEDATEVQAIFTNNKRVTVNIVGNDSYSDIAVLKVDKDNVISVAEIGDSDNSRIGDTTFAVGAPIDSETYSWTVTRGILSGKNRLVEVSATNSRSSYYMDVLQTDTAINSGNSGGPLCNSNGQVIGITNMKLASSSIEGMGFAIPIATAIEYANMFIDGEAITRPYVGITIYDASSSIFSYNLTGVYIESIEKDSPAQKVGLEQGDKITKVDDNEVTSSAYFKYLLYKHNVGDTIKITYERNGKESTVQVTLGSYNLNT